MDCERAAHCDADSLIKAVSFREHGEGQKRPTLDNVKAQNGRFARPCPAPVRARAVRADQGHTVAGPQERPTVDNVTARAPGNTS